MDYRDMLIDKHREKPGLRGKIDAKCIECIYDPKLPGNWRQQVGACAIRGCPLWEVRPKSTTDTVEDDE